MAALNRHLHFLQTDVLPRSNDDWRVGREKFAKKLALELDAGLSAQRSARRSRTRGHARRDPRWSVIARQLWGRFYPTKPVPLDDPAGRRVLIQHVLDAVANDHGTAETLVTDARGTVAEIKSFITNRKILTLLEPDQCRIIEMPEFMRGNSVAYLNPAPPLDIRGSSEYAISPPPRDWSPKRAESYLREYNKAMLKILTIHEAYPGHYVQLEYSNRCPSLIRRVLSSGTFAEGWAVYTEQMMLDQGFGLGDPAFAAPATEVLPPRSCERDPRPQDARPRHDRRRGDGVDGRSRVPDRGRGGRQADPRQAVVLPAFDLLRRPDRLLPAEAANSARDGRPLQPRENITRPSSPTVRFRSSTCLSWCASRSVCPAADHPQVVRAFESTPEPSVSDFVAVTVPGLVPLPRCEGVQRGLD